MTSLHLRAHFLRTEMSLSDLRKTISKANNGQYTHVIADLDHMIADLAEIEQRVTEAEDTPVNPPVRKDTL